MNLFDGHIHSKNSLDSKQTLDEICESAISTGLQGVTVTDHCDMWFYEKESTYQRLASSVSDIEAAREKYKEQIWIGKGVEMAEYLFDSANAEKIMTLTNYDVVLGSVHSVFYEDWNDSYSRISFDDSVCSKKIIGFLKKYFTQVQEMVEKTDIDVVSHLTCPLRYINGKYGRNIDILSFGEQIERILKSVIEKGIALEVNSSGINTAWNEFMPNKEILELYKIMGGKLITLGSDAHVSQNVGNGLEKSVELLKKIGFDYYVFYKSRNAQIVKF